MPSRVRSEMSRRSKCAMAPKTWTTSSPAADEVSRRSSRLTRWMPRVLRSSTVSSSSLSERPSRSRRMMQRRSLEYLRSFGLFGLWQLWQSSGPGGRVHFMIAEKSSDVKVQRVSRLAESKSRCCISHNFGGFYQIIPCIRPAVVRIKVAHGCPATIRIFILGRAVQAWQREPGGRPMPPAMEAKGARSTIRERGSRGQSLSPLRLSSK